MYTAFTVPATRYTHKFIVVIGQQWKDDKAFGLSILSFNPSTLLSVSSSFKHWCLARIGG
jgi:hypothetical protein